ncbi:hypothetical protein BGZ76_006182, partial [Entomortierella beljakovae]
QNQASAIFTDFNCLKIVQADGSVIDYPGFEKALRNFQSSQLVVSGRDVPKCLAET